MDRPHVRIHPTAEVSDEATIGAGTSIWHQAQVREGARVGERCSLGKGVYIDTGVSLGDEVRVQNYVSVYRGVTVGHRVFLGPHCVFSNDFYPRAFVTDFEVTPTVVEDGASICTNATIVCGNRVGAYAMVGAGAVVTRDVPPHALVVGNPARVRGWVCELGHKMEQVEGGGHHCPRCGFHLPARGAGETP